MDGISAGASGAVALLELLAAAAPAGIVAADLLGRRRDDGLEARLRLRRAAKALVDQETLGVPRRALVELADAARPYALTLYDGEPPLVVARPLASGRFDGLTPREREVAALVAAGRANKEIAAELVLSLATVKDHVHSILRKTGLPSRAAVAGAWR